MSAAPASAARFGASRRDAPARSLWPPARWRALPRETRDTWFLLLVIAWTVMPHLGHLPAWAGLMTAAVLLWRARLAELHAPLPGRWVLCAVLAVGGVLTYWSHQTLLGKDAGITMAVTLMALKTLELRARRDAFVVFFLGFFLILAQFLYTQSLLVALSMLVAVWGLLTALVLAHMPVGQPALRHAAWLAARTALLGAPVMLLMFALFPRVGPLWGVPSDGMASTGLSNRMHMGSVAELAQDQSVAMRLKFVGRVPPPQALYFRGPVLSSFDGVEWRPLPPEPAPAAGRLPRPPLNLRVRGEPLEYEATLEPLRMAVLPLLEAAAEAPHIEGHHITRRDDLQYVADRPIYERVRFQARAYLDHAHGPVDPVIGLQHHVELPAGHNPRTLQWAADLQRTPALREADPRTLARAVLTHIRTADFHYTLAPGDVRQNNPRDAIDTFWLDRRKGFCEHFAASFVVVMRAMGVPARVVTGYQGMDPVPVDGYHLVRQSAAHAWAEIWQPGVGWMRVDPTAAVAPERIDRNVRLTPPPGVVENVLAGVNPALLAGLRLQWEALNNRWNQWVLNYSSADQFDLLRHLGIPSPDWAALGMVIAAAIATLAGLGLVWALVERQRIDPWTRQMARMRGALDALGIEAAPHEPPRTLAGRVQQTLGAEGARLVALLLALDAQRYGRTARVRPDVTLTRRFTAEARRVARQGAS